MSKCPNCGAEVDAGMKFCGECGTKIPQDKKCPKCGNIVPVAAKFCGECGYNFNGSGSAGGSVIGDKNVIAGDVNINNTTNYINQDETKKIVKCTVCGVGVLITEAHKCSSCGEYVCADHYDSESCNCVNCQKSKTKTAEDEYRKTLEYILEDGIVDKAEFEQLEQLRKRLGMSAARALELLKQMKAEVATKKKRENKTDALMIVEKTQCERAMDKLYDDCDYVEAYNLISPIYENHPLNDDVLSIYLASMMGIDENRTRSIIEDLPVDIPGAYIASIDIELRNNELSTAEIKLLSAESRWPDDERIKFRRVALLCLTMMGSGNKACLADALDILTSTSVSKNKLNASWQYFLQYNISKILGDDVPELTEAVCKREGVYRAIAIGAMLGLNSLGKGAVALKNIDEELLRIKKVHNDISHSGGDRAYKDILAGYERIANAGNADAMECLALMYRDGNGVDRDYGIAAGWLIRAVNAGSNSANYYLSMLYSDGGPGLAQDKAKSVRFMRHCASAGDADACEILGDWCRYGRMGVKVDNLRAIAYYRRAASTGNGNAKYCLGEMYRDGLGVEKNIEKARSWFSGAMQYWTEYTENKLSPSKRQMPMDDVTIKTSYHAAEIYDAAMKVSKKDAFSACRWLVKSFSLGCVESCSALNAFSIFVQEGKHNFPVDAQFAASMFKTIAENGYGPAMGNLALAYGAGRGVERSFMRAAAWLRKLEVLQGSGCGMAKSRLEEMMEDVHTNQREVADTLGTKGCVWSIEGEHGYWSAGFDKDHGPYIESKLYSSTFDRMYEVRLRTFIVGPGTISFDCMYMLQNGRADVHCGTRKVLESVNGNDGWRHYDCALSKGLNEIVFACKMSGKGGGNTLDGIRISQFRIKDKDYCNTCDPAEMAAREADRIAKEKWG